MGWGGAAGGGRCRGLPGAGNGHRKVGPEGQHGGEGRRRVGRGRGGTGAGEDSDGPDAAEGRGPAAAVAAAVLVDGSPGGVAGGRRDHRARRGGLPPPRALPPSNCPAARRERPINCPDPALVQEAGRGEGSGSGSGSFPGRRLGAGRG